MEQGTIVAHTITYAAYAMTGNDLEAAGFSFDEMRKQLNLLNVGFQSMNFDRHPKGVVINFLFHVPYRGMSDVLRTAEIIRKTLKFNKKFILRYESQSLED